MHNYYFCNDQKIESNHIMLKKKKHETKIHFNIKVFFHQNYSPILYELFSISLKITMCSHHDNNVHHLQNSFKKYFQFIA
jgi:hypothetical protein